MRWFAKPWAWETWGTKGSASQGLGRGLLRRQVASVSPVGAFEVPPLAVWSRGRKQSYGVWVQFAVIV